MIRLFVGLDLPAELDRRLEALGGGIPGARWVAARNLHVTLRFIGEVDEDVAAEIDAALLAVRAAPFSLTLAGFGTFGRPRPNHLWAAVECAAGLLHLHGRIEAALGRLGLSGDGRKYLPHVTLARLSDAPLERVQAFVAGHSPFQAGPWDVKHFVLYRSRLGRGGAEYEALAEYPLG